MTPAQRHDERRRLCDRFAGVLAEAARERKQRQDTVPGPDGYPELAWIGYEREQMRAAVDIERGKHGLPPVPLPDLLRVERLAEGHSDYGRQFAWGCAQLVLPFTEEGTSQ